MNKFIISLIIASASFISIAQEGNKTVSNADFAELQTQELVDFFQLNDELKNKILLVNKTCLDKNASLESTDMHPETIKKGKFYNEEQRQSSIKKLLTAEQVLLMEKFELNCSYCNKSK